MSKEQIEVIVEKVYKFENNRVSVLVRNKGWFEKKNFMLRGPADSKPAKGSTIQAEGDWKEINGKESFCASSMTVEKSKLFTEYLPLVGVFFGVLILVQGIKALFSGVTDHPVAATAFIGSLIALCYVAYNLVGAPKDESKVPALNEPTAADLEAKAFFVRLEQIKWHFDKENPKDYDGQKYWRTRISEIRIEAKDNELFAKMFRAFEDFKHDPENSGKPVLRTFVSSAVEFVRADSVTQLGEQGNLNLVS